MGGGGATHSLAGEGGTPLGYWTESLALGIYSVLGGFLVADGLDCIPILFRVARDI